MFLHFIKEFDFLFLILEHHSDSENFAVKRTEAQIVNLEQMIRLKLTRFLKVRGDAFFVFLPSDDGNMLNMSYSI